MKLYTLKEIAAASCIGCETQANRGRVLSRIAGGVASADGVTRNTLIRHQMHKGTYLTAARLFNETAVYWAAAFFYLTETLEISEQTALDMMSNADHLHPRIKADEQVGSGLQYAVDRIRAGKAWRLSFQLQQYVDGRDWASAFYEKDFVPPKDDGEVDVEISEVGVFGSLSPYALNVAQITLNLNAILVPVIQKIEAQEKGAAT
jgi:hypothetical protein